MSGVGQNLQNALDPLLEVQGDWNGGIVRGQLAIVDCPSLRPTDDQRRGRKKLRPVFLNEDGSRSADRHDQVELPGSEKSRQIFDNRTLLVRLLKSSALERSLVEIDLVRRQLEQLFSKLPC